MNSPKRKHLEMIGLLISINYFKNITILKNSKTTIGYNHLCHNDNNKAHNENCKKKKNNNKITRTNVAAYFIIEGIGRITLHNLYIHFRVICVHSESIISIFNLPWLVQQQHALQYILNLNDNDDDISKSVFDSSQCNKRRRRKDETEPTNWKA
ncbi:hypothetical protein RFI_25285, partial [Reticulomyxa filosa]